MKHPLLFGAFACLLPLTLNAGPALTVYNRDFAVVREIIPLNLKAGTNAVDFAGVTAQVEPDSVVLRDVSGRVPLRILEQSYRADTASQGLLLALNEGREIDFVATDKNAKESLIKGRVIRSGYKGDGESGTPIIEVDGKLRFSLPGQPLFPSLGDDAILRPTLSWLVSAERAATLEAELGYITGGMNWQAAYNFIAPEKGDLVEIVGWVTVTNRTGKAFTDATIKLMAGDVNRVQPQDQFRGQLKMAGRAPAGVSMQEVTEKAFDEFHLYSLPRAVTLRDQETKQVEFLRASGVTAPQLYIYDHQKYGGKVATVREFKNTKENGGLGLPLPKGRTRFYRKDSSDERLEFVGENTIDHTAKNETLRIYTGDVFDIAAERKALDSKVSKGDRQLEEAFEITLRNRKTEAVEVRVTERFYSGRNWTMIEQSAPSVKTDAQTAEFRVQLQSGEERQISYRVRYDWK
jgi:hypothetical protein